MAAGVGKTFAMLNAARELISKGFDVAAGYIETHGRMETDALAAGIDTVPRRIVPYRNVSLGEMDLDAVLKRRPQVALVDEAAHTNAPGSRHAKRWHDILEILDSGIDVYTTLNIQHLESLSDTVREITGVTVAETIPDLVIDMADEVVLIDLAPEELIKRLGEGKVYGVERAGRAMQNFFRPGNLSALREMSLRIVADRVNRELRDYKQVHHITDSWKTRHRLMVAVYASPYSEILIRWTRRMASGLDAEWYGAYIESDVLLNEDESRLLAKNLSLVKELGGVVLTSVDNDPVRGLIRLARENQVTQIVAGKSRRGFMHNLRRGGSVVGRLLKESGNIDIYVVSGEPTDESLPRGGSIEQISKSLTVRDIAVVAATPVFLGLLGWVLNSVIHYRAVGMIFLIGVTVLGMFVSRYAVLAGAFLCGLVWNFFFIPPHYTFYISATEDIMMFGMFFGAAGVVGHLTSRLRENERRTRVRERRVTALYHLTREIASAKNIHDILDAAVENISSVFDAETAILVKDPVKGMSPHEGNTFAVDENEMGVAEWSALHGRPAGLGTDTLPTAKALYIPLVASQGTVGVLGMRPRRRRPDTPELTALAETFARQLAMGIEREQFNEIARRTLLIQESERLYKSILNSMSHELKTPLATIEGAASALLDPIVGRDPETSQELAGEIVRASQRLARLVRNLLDMTRLESGVVPLRREPGDINDLISTALRYLEKDLEGRSVSMDVQDGLPLVSMDFILMEQVVVNILHNVSMHTPAAARIEISVRVEGNKVAIRIRDTGPGLPAQNPEQVFEKFWRADPQKPGGTGLGLAIAKGWVEAHGGTLNARNNPGGGAEFAIMLPVETNE